MNMMQNRMPPQNPNMNNMNMMQNRMPPQNPNMNNMNMMQNHIVPVQNHMMQNNNSMVPNQMVHNRMIPAQNNVNINNHILAMQAAERATRNDNMNMIDNAQKKEDPVQNVMNKRNDHTSSNSNGPSFINLKSDERNKRTSDLEDWFEQRKKTRESKPKTTKIQSSMDVWCNEKVGVQDSTGSEAWFPGPTSNPSSNDHCAGELGGSSRFASEIKVIGDAASSMELLRPFGKADTVEKVSNAPKTLSWLDGPSKNDSVVPPPPVAAFQHNKSSCFLSPEEDAVGPRTDVDSSSNIPSAPSSRALSPASSVMGSLENGSHPLPGHGGIPPSAPSSPSDSSQTSSHTDAASRKCSAAKADDPATHPSVVCSPPQLSADNKSLSGLPQKSKSMQDAATSSTPPCTQSSAVKPKQQDHQTTNPGPLSGAEKMSIRLPPTARPGKYLEWKIPGQDLMLKFVVPKDHKCGQSISVNVKDSIVNFLEQPSVTRNISNGENVSDRFSKCVASYKDYLSQWCCSEDTEMVYHLQRLLVEHVRSVSGFHKNKGNHVAYILQAIHELSQEYQSLEGEDRKYEIVRLCHQKIIFELTQGLLPKCRDTIWLSILNDGDTVEMRNHLLELLSRVGEKLRKDYNEKESHLAELEEPNGLQIMCLQSDEELKRGDDEYRNEHLESASMIYFNTSIVLYSAIDIESEEEGMAKCISLYILLYFCELMCYYKQQNFDKIKDRRDEFPSELQNYHELWENAIKDFVYLCAVERVPPKESVGPPLITPKLVSQICDDGASSTTQDATSTSGTESDLPSAPSTPNTSASTPNNQEVHLGSEQFNQRLSVYDQDYGKLGRPRKANEVLIFLDGLNIATGTDADGGKYFKAHRILKVKEFFEEKGHEVIVVLPQGFFNSNYKKGGHDRRCSRKDIPYLERLDKQKAVLEVPSGDDDDNMMIQAAIKYKGCVVSNDRYRDKKMENQNDPDFIRWIDENRISYSWLNIMGEEHFFVSPDRYPPPCMKFR